jgi:cytochrome c553
MKKLMITIAMTTIGTAGLAADGPVAEINPPVSATTQEGLAAFDRIYEVASHPRCANCHVGADNVPMWSGAYYGETRPHGMNVNAGESRIGVETLVCSTCHRTNDNFATDPHAPPRAGLDWQLPPVEFEWFGKTPAEICAQLSDPDRNGGRDWMGLAEHLIDDAGHLGFVLWGWQPGGGREPAPYSLQAHVDDVTIWGVAGQPCPTE